MTPIRCAASLFLAAIALPASGAPQRPHEDLAASDAATLRGFLSSAACDLDRTRAATVLGERRDAASVDRLIALLESDGSRAARAAAAEALGAIGDSRANEALVAALEDHAPAVRLAAQHALEQLFAGGRFGDAGTIARLGSSVSGEPPPDTKLASRDLRLPRVYELREGFSGWVRIDYSTPECAPLKVADGRIVFRIARDGSACTRAAFDDADASLAGAEVVWVSGAERVPVPRNQIWRGAPPDAPADSWRNERSRREGFFVGTALQYRQARGCRN
jgi:hypothetical protein